MHVFKVTTAERMQEKLFKCFCAWISSKLRQSFKRAFLAKIIVFLWGSAENPRDCFYFQRFHFISWCSSEPANDGKLWIFKIFRALKALRFTFVSVDPSEPRKFYASVVVKSVVEARLHAVEWVEHMVKRFITTFCVYLHEFPEQIDSKKREAFSVNLHVYDQLTIPSIASIFHSSANWKTFLLFSCKLRHLKTFFRCLK